MYKTYCKGCRPAGLEEVLADREQCARRQRELLSRYGTAASGEPRSLLSLGLNIPGEYKRFPLGERCFREELRIAGTSLEAEAIPVIHKECSGGAAGSHGFIVAGAEAGALKELAENIEDTHPLGRLFDIDVLDGRGDKLSRLEGGRARPCLICGKPAFICARSRAHRVEDLFGAVIGIMEHFIRERLGDIITSSALRALVGEAAVTPKPGLVDRANSGAHRDMDFFSFIDSTAALLPWFRDCALAGYGERPGGEDAGEEDTGGPGGTLPSAGQGDDPEKLFRSLRQRGRAAELLMRRAAGTNTHRGLLFSLGILSAAYGRLYRESEGPSTAALLDFAARMTRSLGDDFSRPRDRPSHGEAIYAHSGITGIRGEVSAGFPTVRDWGLPTLRRLVAEGRGLNDAGLGALLQLMAHTDDTNIIHRAGRQGLETIRAGTAAFLAGNPGMEEMRQKAAEMDRDFIARNISPGGAADLLAVSIFLHTLEAGPPGQSPQSPPDLPAAGPNGFCPRSGA
jgi:holo-ACP synthase/triphosphoribosyl-dephospho-CoA synthase